MQKRFKSKVFWTSFIALLMLCIGELGLWKQFNIDQSMAQYVTDTILGLLVTVGILNNPTSKDSF